MPSRTTAENFPIRFWAKVNKAGPRIAHMPTDCWVWTGSHDTVQSEKMIGYGLSWRGGRWEKAHRVSWELEYGRRPAALIRHQCDNPRCVRPDHLLEGTDADNAADKVSRNRQQRLKGEAHGRALLTEEDVQMLRETYVPRNVTLKSLADQLGVTIQTVHAAITGRNWSHLENRNARVPEI